MKFKRNAPRLLLLSTFIVTGLTMLITIWLFSGLINSTEKKQFDLMRRISVNALTSAQDRALARAEMIASLPVVRETFARRDRQKLLSETIDMFKLQKEKYGVVQAQFHIPPAVSFLRLNAPKLYGDDLTSFRPIVVSANQQKTPIKAVSLTRTGPGLFGITPVKDMAGKHIGTFEMGMDFGAVLDSLKSTYGFDTTLFMDEELLSTVSTGLKGDVLNKQNRVGKYLRFHTTHTELMKELVQDSDLNSDEEKDYVRTAYNKPYGLVLFPIKNLSGKPIGIIAVSSDFSSSRADALQMRVWQLLLAVFGVVIQFGVIKVILQGLLLRPLEVVGTRFTELVRGTTNKTIDGSEHFPEEMQELVTSYEKIRTKDI